jgi:hypothetical protein
MTKGKFSRAKIYVSWVCPKCGFEQEVTKMLSDEFPATESVVCWCERCNASELVDFHYEKYRDVILLR